MKKSLTEDRHESVPHLVHHTVADDFADRAAAAFGEAISVAFGDRHRVKKIQRMFASRGCAVPGDRTIQRWLAGTELPSWKHMMVFVSVFGEPLLWLVFEAPLQKQDTTKHDQESERVAVRATG